MQPLVVLLMQLFAACMDPDVPPQDALLAVQGPMALQASRQLFSLTWFRSVAVVAAVAAVAVVVTLHMSFRAQFDYLPPSHTLHFISSSLTLTTPCAVLCYAMLCNGCAVQRDLLERRGVGLYQSPATANSRSTP